MRPDRFPPDDPREWINRARSNLAIARNRVPAAYLEDLCFEAQQAAEKAIKAVMIRRGIEFPYIHDLGRLLRILEEHGGSVPEAVFQGTELTKYALVSRYPGIAGVVSEQDYADALRLAETVLDWAEEQIGQRPAPK